VASDGTEPSPDTGAYWQEHVDRYEAALAQFISITREGLEIAGTQNLPDWQMCKYLETMLADLNEFVVQNVIMLHTCYETLRLIHIQGKARQN
jgi:hypothetical protein